MENFEDDHGAVHDLATHFLFQIARLRGGNFVIDKERIQGFGRRITLDIQANFLALARA